MQTLIFPLLGFLTELRDQFSLVLILRRVQDSSSVCGILGRGDDKMRDDSPQVTLYLPTVVVNINRELCDKTKGENVSA